MQTLPRELTLTKEAPDGAELIEHGTAEHFPIFRTFWCEQCKQYRLWPGDDWGASHYFCTDCLEKLELEQGYASLLCSVLLAAVIAAAFVLLPLLHHAEKMVGGM